MTVDEDEAAAFLRSRGWRLTSPSAWANRVPPDAMHPGDRYHHLTVVRREGTAHPVWGGKRVSVATYRFRCDCGTEVVKTGTWVKQGKVRSCGCMRGSWPQRRKGASGLTRSGVVTAEDQDNLLGSE